MYLYSAYAPQLAAQLSLNATSTSFIGMVGNLGMAMTGPLAGVVVDKKGPKFPVLIGAIATFVGYSIIKKCYQDKIDTVGILAAALLLVGAGSTFTFSAVVKCAALNFPNARGFATSVPMAAFGLSAFFLSTIASIYMSGDTFKFLQLLSFLPSTLFLVSLYFIRFPHVAQTTENIELEPVTDVDHDIGTKHKQEDIHGSQLLRNRLFWSHFLVMGVLAGIGQMYIYSCGYVVRALLGNADAVAVQRTQSVQVGLISLSSFGGRLLSGSLSDYLSHKIRYQRTWLLVGAGGISLLAQIAGLTIQDASQLWIISMATGIAYGICYGSYPTIVGDSFGMKHFSQNWGLLALSPVSASYMFNMLFGYYYDINSTTDTDGHQTCTLGRACYSSAFKITILGALFVIFMALESILINRKR